MRRTKIVATLGPKSNSKETIAALIDAGVDVVRCNLAHGTHEEHARRIALVREHAASIGKYVAVLVDIGGPKMRLGEVGRRAILKPGADFFLSYASVLGDSRQASLNHPSVLAHIRPGMTVYLDDGMLKLEAIECAAGGVRCKVRIGGALRTRVGVAVPDAELDLCSFDNKDKNDLSFAVAQRADFVGFSFMRSVANVLEGKKLLEEYAKAHHVSVPASMLKYETKEAAAHAEEMMLYADAVMVARGDLGLSVPIEQVPQHQKTLIALALKYAKPVITATQMLESMVEHAMPERAEVSDIANAILDGTDAVMLSSETARGRFPVESVAMMAKIAAYYDGAQQGLREHARVREDMSVAEGVEIAAARLAADLGAQLIVVFTETGTTARRIARHRPRQPILALSPHEKVLRQLALVHGVIPRLVPPVGGVEEMLDLAKDVMRKEELVKPHERFLITGGIPFGASGTTNFIKAGEL